MEQPAKRSRAGWSESPAMAWRAAASAALALIALGCSNAQPDVSQQPPPVEIRAAALSLDPDRIPVQSGALALPYHQLGVLEYVEPFSPQAIDEDHIDDRLRTMAIQNWGNDVDAIVGVKTSLSREDNQVTVSAQVVKVTGDCSFCRHASGFPPSQ